ncbi:MAG: hypothetical protein Q8918_18470 [Bacteroidota bacterium]|nr:hypothetical protein [Bacteroidota bacterium]MDP4252090.1 hypothetical protein [Bacteroidota bacterium]
MKKKSRLPWFFLLMGILGPALLCAQDLTGIWRGHFRNNGGLERMMPSDDRYKIEVQIAQTNNIFHAVTYSYKQAEFYGKADASGTINPKSKKVLLRELKILEFRAASGGVCIMTCFLQYSRLGDDEFLQGTFTTTGVGDSSTESGCGKGSIFLHKVATSDFHKESFLEKKEKELLAEKKREAIPRKTATPNIPVKKPEITSKKPVPGTVVKKLRPHGAEKLKSVPAPERKSVTTTPEQRHGNNDSALNINNRSIPVIIPKVLATRANEHIKTITVNNTEVYLNIYDDGAIDNDTVSVYYDNKLIISKARISDQPVKATIRVEPSDQPHELVMVAENLGDIPPNTSLMVVRDGDKKYEVRVVSNEQKNAVISFQYKKIE